VIIYNLKFLEVHVIYFCHVKIMVLVRILMIVKVIFAFVHLVSPVKNVSVIIDLVKKIPVGIMVNI